MCSPGLRSPAPPSFASTQGLERAQFQRHLVAIGVALPETGAGPQGHADTVQRKCTPESQSWCSLAASVGQPLTQLPKSSSPGVGINPGSLHYKDRAVPTASAHRPAGSCAVVKGLVVDHHQRIWCGRRLSRLSRPPRKHCKRPGPSRLGYQSRAEAAPEDGQPSVVLPHLVRLRC
jgi:hypothetical protein